MANGEIGVCFNSFGTGDFLLQARYNFGGILLIEYTLD
jgi:hypothetical protein